jgi:predicted nucleic acid-binding protein
MGFVRVVETPDDDPLMALLSADVDCGEAAAIALAKRCNSPLLIVDDMAGRRLAKRLGLTITGTVGSSSPQPNAASSTMRFHCSRICA